MTPRVERPQASARPRARDVVIVVLLIVGLVSSLVLVVTGSDPADPGTTTTSTSVADELPTEDVSKEAVALMSGLAFPDGAADFLTSRISQEQLDVTFTMAAEDEAAFVAGSGLPTPTPGERTVLHSSPLWKLNPTADEDSTESSTTTDPSRIRGTSDTYEGVDRAVELFDESPGTVRARVVLTAAD